MQKLFFLVCLGCCVDSSEKLKDSNWNVNTVETSKMRDLLRSPKIEYPATMSSFASYPQTFIRRAVTGSKNEFTFVAKLSQVYVPFFQFGSKTALSTTSFPLAKFEFNENDFRIDILDYRDGCKSKLILPNDFEIPYSFIYEGERCALFSVKCPCYSEEDYYFTFIYYNNYDKYLDSFDNYRSSNTATKVKLRVPVKNLHSGPRSRSFSHDDTWTITEGGELEVYRAGREKRPLWKVKNCPQLTDRLPLKDSLSILSTMNE